MQDSVSMGVLIRTEAGGEIGLGHLRRSISLAEALQAKGVRSHLLVNGRRENLRYLEQCGFVGNPVPESIGWRQGSVAWSRQMAGRFGAGALVVDSPNVPPGYLDELQATGLMVILRDDLGGRALPAHVVLNGNADAPTLDYSRCPGGTLFWLGAQYAVLPKEFWNPPARVVRRNVKQVLVVLGGSDGAGLMREVIACLEALPGDFSVVAVLGPFFERREEIRGTGSRTRRKRKVLCVEDPVCLKDWIWSSDLAISGGGQTLYELACLGCPTVALELADDQRGQMEALAREGCLLPIARTGQSSESLIRTLQGNLLRLLEDAHLRSQMAQAGQRCVDGRGASRVGEGILGELRRRILFEVGR